MDVPETLRRALADRYRLDRELGQGGMATVYLATDLRHQRSVAIKVLRPELAAVLGGERFLREIRITAKLQHPHILPLLDSGEAGGVPEGAAGLTPDGRRLTAQFLYYVMPYVEGESLRERLTREGQLPLEDALALTRQIASALDCAHQQGIVHRDIKPENILLSKGEAVVADFGIALAVRAAGGERLTETGLSLGTPQYMSPEQATGARAVDSRSDVYSLGAVLYEMLVGEPPHTGATAEVVLAKLLTAAPVEPRAVRRAVPEHVNAAVLKALAKQLVDRFASAAEFAAALTADGGRQTAELSIVVLPFENLSPDPDNAFFADGLTEELIAALSKVRVLRVISRTTAMLLKGSKKDVPTIARELKVRYVLEGSVRRAGNALRITAQLIDASTDVHLWADAFNGTLEDVFGIQERVARSIAGALEVTLDAGTSAKLAERPIASAAAYDCYLRAMQSVWEFTEAGLKRAVEHLNRALAIAGDNALLHGALAYVWYQHANIGLEPNQQFRERAREAAERALALDPDAPLAHLAVGMLIVFEQPAEGIRYLKRVLRAAPGQVEALLWLAAVLSWIKPEAARLHVEAARALDPLHPMVGWVDGILLMRSGDFEKAEVVLRAATRSARLPLTLWFLAMTLGYLGSREEAAALFEEAFRGDEGTMSYGITQAFAHALRDERESAWRILRSDLETSAQVRRDFAYTHFVAECHALLGDVPGALEWLERSVSLGNINYPFLSRHDPFLAPLRSEPRFRELMVRVKHAWETFEA